MYKVTLQTIKVKNYTEEVRNLSHEKVMCSNIKLVGQAWYFYTHYK